MRKKQLWILVALVAVGTIALVSASAGAAGRSSPQKKPIVIGISNYAGVIPFYRAMTAGFQDAAKKYGWNIVVTDSNFDPNKQISNIESLITKHVDAIIASPGDENALIPAYKAAFKAGIPILSIANHIAPTAKQFEASFYGRPWNVVAELRTRRLVSLLNGKGKIIVIAGPSGVAFVQEDKQGFERVIKQSPSIKVVFDQNAKDISNAEGLRLAEDALTAHPDVNGIWVETDDLAEGVVRALKERNLAGKVPIVSMDGAPAALDLIKDGQLTFTAALPTYSWALDYMSILRSFLVERKPLPKYVPAQVVPATRANAAQLISGCPQHPAELWCAGRK